MKIYIVSRGYPTQKDPQWGCFERDQAMALRKLGHEIIMISVDRRLRFNSKRIIYNYDNVHVYDYKTILPGKLLSVISAELYVNYLSNKMLHLFNLTIKKHGFPDIIYVHFQSNMALMKKVKEKYEIPIVGMEHWSAINKIPLPNFVYQCGKIAYRNVDVLLSVSNSLNRRIKQIWDKDSLVIHNMVGEEFFNQNVNRNKKGNKIVFVSTGSLIKRKGYDVLIKALNIINSQLSNWELNIIGEGSERGTLQKMINTNQLNDKIKLVGKKNKMEIISYLHNSDVFLFPSRMENFSVAVLEALSAGLPVIATICGGIRECINETNGLLVPVEDVDALAYAILNISNNINHYSRDYIAENCKMQYAPDIIAQKLTTIFNDVMTNHNKKI